MGVTFAQSSLDRYCRDGMYLFQIPILAKQSQIVALFRANNSGGANPSGVRSSVKEASDRVLVDAADDEY